MVKHHDDFTKLERIRSELAAKREALEEVERAPIPIEEARAQVRTWIRGSAEQLDVPSLGDFARDGFTGPLVLAHLADRSDNRALERVGFVRSAADDLTALFCAVAGEELERVICDRLEKVLAEVSLVLPADERTAKLATLRGEIHGLEVEEERIVRSLEDRGVEIARRTGVRPEIVLALDLDRVAEAA